MLLPDWIIVWLAVTGGSALILGASRIGLAFLLPAAIRFVVVPTLKSELSEIPPVVLNSLVPFALILGAILVLKVLVQAIYGKQTAGHVAGTYLVRAFDTFGRGIAAVIGLPFRLWRRGRGE